MVMSKPETIVKIMISGYYGFNNTGDESILQSMVRAFKEKLPRIKIVVLSHNPRQTAQNYAVEAISRLNLLDILSSLRGADLFISGGGGLLQDSSGKGWSVWYYLGLIGAAVIFRVPVIVYAQGIGPINRKFNQLLVKWILNQAKIITVRDKTSQELLKRWGVNRPPIYLTADPCFLLKKKNIDQVIKDLPDIQRLLCSHNSPLVGISLRGYQNQRPDFRQVLAQLADELIENYEAKIIFLPFKFNEDLSISEEVLLLMKNKNQAEILRRGLEAEELISFISQLSLVVGMRLHSIMFSTIACTPFIALSYDPKVKNFVEDLALTELLLELEDISLKKLRKKVEYVEKNRGRIKGILSERVQNLEEKARKNNALVFDFLKLNH